MFVEFLIKPDFLYRGLGPMSRGFFPGVQDDDFSGRQRGSADKLLSLKT